MNGSASRSVLGWAIPTDDWKAFVSYVADRWTEDAETLRFELERAMIEFMDLDDDLAEAERLLRDHLDVRGLSSSTHDALVRDVDPDDKVKIGIRVRETVQDRFRSFVSKSFNGGHTARYATYTESHTTYGEALTAAINEYRDGGSGRRIKSFAEEIVAGHSGRDRNSVVVENTDTESDEVSTNDPTSITGDGESVRADVVLAVAEDLDESFVEDELTRTIEKHVGREHTAATDDLIGRYADAVLDELPVVEHPLAEKELYISEKQRSEITAWDDLNKETRVTRLRRLVARKTFHGRGPMEKFDYTDVQGLFNSALGHKPSHQYAYDVMRMAANAGGFSFGKHHGQKVLKCNLTSISNDLRRDLVENWDCDGLAGGVNTDANSWIDGVVDDLTDLPEHVVSDVMTGRIAREKYAEPRDFDAEGDLVVDDDRLEELESRVTDEDRRRVCDRLGIGDKAEDKLDALDVGNAAVATDGGHPADD